MCQNSLDPAVASLLRDWMLKSNASHEDDSSAESGDRNHERIVSVWGRVTSWLESDFLSMGLRISMIAIFGGMATVALIAIRAPIPEWIAILGCIALVWGAMFGVVLFSIEMIWLLVHTVRSRVSQVKS